jgi:hypothetical protein
MYTRPPWEALLLVMAFVWIFPYSGSLNNPNERTRVMQARAIVDKGAFSIGRVERRGKRWVSIDLYGSTHRYDARRGAAFVNDVALVCDDTTQSPPVCVGNIYPAKAPGAALLGVPALWLAEQLGVVPSGVEGEVLATWVLRYGAVFPCIALGLFCLFWLLRNAGVSEGRRRATVLAAALGSGVFPYGLMMVGHATAGAALIGALTLMLVARSRHTATLAGLWLAIAGVVAGWAVLLEYHAVLGVLVLCLWIVLMPPVRVLGRLGALVAFVGGGAITAGIFGWIHHNLFGAPWKTGHYYLMSAHNRESQSKGLLGMDGFHLDALVDHLFSPYMGLAPMMTWLLVGVAVALPLVLSRKSTYAGLGAAVGIVLIYLAFVSTLGQWRTMNGWSIGPRYLAPVMLPMAYVAGVGWDALGRRLPFAGAAFGALAAASMVIVGLTTAAYPSPPNSVTNPFGELALPLLDDGFGVRNLGLTLDFGAQSLIPFILLLSTACTAVMVQGAGRKCDQDRLSWTSLMVGTLIAAIISGLTGFQGTLVLICTVPFIVVSAIALHPWVERADRSAPWIACLIAATVLLPSILPEDGVTAALSEKFAFGIPAFVSLVLAGVILVGRGVGVVNSASERIAVVVGLIIAAILVVSFADYAPTEPREVQRAFVFCKDTVEGAKPDGAGHFLASGK